VLGDLRPNAYVNVPQFHQQTPGTDLTIVVTVTVTSDTPDPHPENNNVTRTIIVTTGPQLGAFLLLPRELDPGLPFVATLQVFNSGYSAAHHVIATVDLPDGSAVESLPSNCTAGPLQVTCTLDVIAANTNYFSAVPLRLRLRAPLRYEGGPVLFEVRAHADERDFDGPFHFTAGATLFRTFLVTTGADDGDGSLRAAITAANAGCFYPMTGTPPDCSIQFNIGETGETTDKPWKTIRLQSPLPPIRAYSLHIDGATQTAFSGVANPDGPPIEISGGGTVAGDGLDTATCIVNIAHLAINGFLGNGLSLRNLDGVVTTDCRISIAGNYIGTDPTGSVAVPNYRGIGTIQSNGPYYIGSDIAGNVLSGNIRSGLFALAGILNVQQNRIGVKAHSDEPLPNGGSGIYIDQGVYRSEVSYNVIAFNREMGIAVHPGTLYAKFWENRIWGNGGLAIDDGLDGPSVTVKSDTGPIIVPVLTSAVYDPVKNETTIAGDVPNGNIEVFVSDAAGPAGSGEAQRRLSYSSAINDHFTLTVKGDLRGQWVAATATLYAKYNPYPDVIVFGRTTELSRALQVH
jgi:hypothetical protein